MEEELISAVPCSSLTVESVIRVATVRTRERERERSSLLNSRIIFKVFVLMFFFQAGGLYGFCAGPRDARRIGNDYKTLSISICDFTSL